MTVQITFRESRYGFTTGALPVISVDCDRCGESADFHHFDVDDEHGYLGTVCSVCRADEDATVFTLRPDLAPVEREEVSA